MTRIQNRVPPVNPDSTNRTLFRRKKAAMKILGELSPAESRESKWVTDIIGAIDLILGIRAELWKGAGI